VKREIYKCPKCGTERPGKVVTKNGMTPFIYRSWRHCNSVLRPTGRFLDVPRRMTFAQSERLAEKQYRAEMARLAVEEALVTTREEALDANSLFDGPEKSAYERSYDAF